MPRIKLETAQGEREDESEGSEFSAERDSGFGLSFPR
jgi:hypothetical protein